MSDEEWIENPLTGRYVKKGSKTYKTLIKSGTIQEKEESEIEDSEIEDSEIEEESIDDIILNDEPYEESSTNEDEEEEDIKRVPKLTTIPLNIDIDNMDDDEINNLYKMLKKFNT